MTTVGRYILAASLIGIVGGKSVHVLASSSNELVPIDQGVEDLDPLATSLRQIGTGLRSDGEHTNLFKLIAPGERPYDEPVYYRIAPGFVAKVNRLDYLVVRDDRLHVNIPPERDGQFVELLPADAVYVLPPIEQAVGDQLQVGPTYGWSMGQDVATGPTSPAFAATTAIEPLHNHHAVRRTYPRVTYRIDARVIYRINARVDPWPLQRSVLPARSPWAQRSHSSYDGLIVQNRSLFRPQ